MEPGLLLVQCLDGITMGMFYFLVASGLILVFGVLDVINFAHGSFYMIGAYVAWTVFNALTQHIGGGIAFWLTGIMVIFITGVVGAFTEILLFRKTYESEALYQLLLSFGIIFLMDGILLEIWGGIPKSLPTPDALAGPVMIAGRTFPKYLLFLLLAGIFFSVVLWFLLYRTRFGLYCRAAAMDRQMTEALGINVPILFTLLFSLGTGLAGLAGLLGAPLRAITLGAGHEVILLAFAIIVIGGMSLEGTLIACLLLGLAQSFAQYYFQEIAMVIPFIFMVVVLMIRPKGLLGARGFFGSKVKE